MIVISCRKEGSLRAKVFVLYLPTPSVAFIRAVIRGAKGERSIMMTVGIIPGRLLIG